MRDYGSRTLMTLTYCPNSSKPYDIISRELLQNSDSYRSYLLNKLFPRDSTDSYLYAKYGGDTRRAAPWIDFKKSANISDPFIRDWYLTTISKNAIINYDFVEAYNVLEKSLIEITDPSFKLLLSGFRDQVNSTRSNKIPDLDMVGTDGKHYNFDSFRGKVLYITFYTTTCAPCLLEFESYRPAFNSKFNKQPDLVSINVCLNGDDATWKKIIDKYNVAGVNVRAQFDVVSPKFQLYSFPRYVIVDKQGKVHENSAESSSSFLKENSVIDQLLQQ